MSASGRAKKGKTPEATDAFLRLREELLNQFVFRTPRGDSTLLDDRLTMLLSPSTALEFASKKDEHSIGMFSKVNTTLKAPPMKQGYLILLKSPHERLRDQDLIYRRYPPFLSQAVSYYSRFNRRSTTKHYDYRTRMEVLPLP